MKTELTKEQKARIDLENKQNSLNAFISEFEKTNKCRVVGMISPNEALQSILQAGQEQKLNEFMLNTTLRIVPTSSNQVGG